MGNIRKAILDNLANQLSTITTANGYPITVDLVVKNRILSPDKISWRHKVILMLAYDSRTSDRTTYPSNRTMMASYQFACFCVIRNGTFEELFQLIDAVEEAVSKDPTQNDVIGEAYNVYDTYVSSDDVMIPSEIDEDLADGENRAVEAIIRISVEAQYLPEKISTGL